MDEVNDHADEMLAALNAAKAAGHKQDIMSALGKVWDVDDALALDDEDVKMMDEIVQQGFAEDETITLDGIIDYVNKNIFTSEDAWINDVYWMVAKYVRAL